MNAKFNSLEKILRKWGFFISLLLLAALLLYIFSDYIFLQKIYLFKDVANDSLNIFYPKWIYTASYLRNYGIPMWSFKIGMGQNFFPGGINSPFNMILYCMGKNLAYGIIYVEILKITLVWTLSYLYFRTINFSKYIAVTGGFILAFSGYMMAGSSGWYGHSSLIVYGVFMLFSFEQLYLKKNWYYFPIAIVLISSSSPFYVYIFSVFLFFYTLLRVFSDNGYDIKKLSYLLLKMAGLGLLGLCMNAIFLISSFLKIFYSPRVSGNAGHFNGLLHSPVLGLASPKEYYSIILKFFGNDILGTGEIFIREINNQQIMLQSYKGWGNYFESPLFYCSIPVLLLVPQIFIFLKKHQKILYAVFITFWLSILIFPFFRYALYLFAGNYFKGGLNFFIPVLMVLFSMQALNMIRKTGRINISLLISTCVILMIILNFPYFKEGELPVISQIQIFASSLLLIYTFLIAMLPHRKYASACSLLLLLVLLCELGYLSSITINNRGALTVTEFKSKHGYNDYTVDALKFIKARDKCFYRIQKEYYSTPAVYESLNDAMVQDFYGTSSYSSFNQKNYINFLASANIIDSSNESHTRWAPGLVRNPVLQSFASIKYGLSRTKDIYFAQFGYKLIHKCGDIYIYENQLFLPLGFTYDKYMLKSEFMKLTQLERGSALLKAVILNDSDRNIAKSGSILSGKYISRKYDIASYEKDIAALRQQTLKIHNFTPNCITGTISLPKEKMMLFSIPYDKDWKAVIDKTRVPIFLVDSGLIGVIIPQGKHHIELNFTPSNLISGAIISLIAICVYIALLFIIPQKRLQVQK
jgi:hypothetical protein